jgi:hypothetical protein
VHDQKCKEIALRCARIISNGQQKHVAQQSIIKEACGACGANPFCRAINQAIHSCSFIRLATRKSKMPALVMSTFQRKSQSP